MYRTSFQDVLEAEKGAKQKPLLFFKHPVGMPINFSYYHFIFLNYFCCTSASDQTMVVETPGQNIGISCTLSNMKLLTRKESPPPPYDPPPPYHLALAMEQGHCQA